MTSSLRKIGSLCGGHYVSEFLKSCTCGADKCNNLLTFEKTEEVVCNGVASIKQGWHSQIPDLGHQQKVGIQVGRSEKVGFYKGTFRAQTRYDRTFSQFFGTF